MDPRRTLIADSALAVIAERGMRGLTHLAVDEYASLPKGSTSYYCRKRIDLLRLALERLFVIDRVELEEVSATLTADGPFPEEHVTDVMAGVVEHWLTEPRRSITYARFELFLAVAHEPELREMNQAHMLDMVQLFLAVGAATDPPKAFDQIATTAMMADGLMLVVLRQGLPTPSRAEIVQLLATSIGGAPQTAPSEDAPDQQAVPSTIGPPEERVIASLWGSATD